MVGTVLRVAKKVWKSAHRGRCCRQLSLFLLSLTGSFLTYFQALGGWAFILFGDGAKCEFFPLKRSIPNWVTPCASEMSCLLGPAGCCQPQNQRVCEHLGIWGGACAQGQQGQAAQGSSWTSWKCTRTAQVCPLEGFSSKWCAGMCSS